jgi:hypothetical protein
MAKEPKTISVDELAKALKSLSEPKEGHEYTALQGEVGEKASEKIKPLIGAFKNHGAAHVDTAKEYLSAQETLKGFIEPVKEGGFKLNETFESIEDVAKKAELETAFQKFTAAEEKLGELAKGEHGAGIVSLSKKLGGATGLMNTEGALAAAKHNLTHFSGRPAQAFGRIAGTGLCAVGLSDGLFRSKTNNGEDRSVITRGAEIGLFALGAAALVLANKAHINAKAVTA